MLDILKDILLTIAIPAASAAGIIWLFVTGRWGWGIAAIVGVILAAAIYVMVGLTDSR